MSGVAAAITGGAVIAGSYLSGQAAKSAAEKGAAGQVEAARIAADAARFTPYNITTALGGVRFGDQTADILYNPQLAAYRDKLFGLATSTLPEDIQQAEALAYEQQRRSAERLFNQQTAALGTGLFRTGRQGLNVFGAQPETRAFAAAMSDQELALRMAAQQEVANRVAQSTGLFQSGLGVENALLQPLEIGANLGGRAASAGAVQANALLQGGLSAAQLRTQGGMVGPALMANNLSNLATNPAFMRGVQGLFGQPASTASIYSLGYGQPQSLGYMGGAQGLNPAAAGSGWGYSPSTPSYDMGAVNYGLTSGSGY